MYEYFLLEKGSTKKFKISLLVWAIMLIIIREPKLLTHPRFWAEEGSTYFKFATQHTFLEALLAPHIDYYSLVPNFATALANLFPLKSAPLVCTIIALFMQMIPVFVLIFGKFKYWQTPLQKIVFVICCITLPESETWLNTINSQFFLGLAVALLLLEAEYLNKTKKIFALIVLLISGLMGPLSAFLTPLYLYKGYVKKQKNVRQLSVVLLLTSIFQTSLFFYLHYVQPSSTTRFSDFNFSILIKGFFAEFFGLIKFVGANDKKNIGIVLSIYLILLFVDSYKKKIYIDFEIITSFFVVAVLSIAGSLNMGGATRYAYIPCMLLVILIYSDVLSNKPIESWRKNVSGLIFIVTFTAYVFFYRYDRLGDFKGPKWKDEVKAWEKDPTKSLKIYPEGWEFCIDKNARQKSN